NPEHVDVRKDFAESPEHRSQAFIRQLIDLQPLHKNSVAAQSFTAQSEEFAGEKIRNARHPRMAGLAYYYVIQIWIDSQISARVVDDCVQPGSVQRMFISIVE